jgi:hypothetical protein
VLRGRSRFGVGGHGDGEDERRGERHQSLWNTERKRNGEEEN